MDSESEIPRVVAVVVRWHPRLGGGDVEICLIDAECHERNVGRYQLPRPSERPLDVVWATMRTCRDAGIANVIFDFVNVGWINSNGLGNLIFLWGALAKEGHCEVVLANLNQRVINILAVTKLDEVMPNAGSVAQAVEHYSSASRENGA